MIAAYKRISLSDGDLGRDGKDKSNSIENQGELIKNYIEAKADLQGIPVIEYIDDGYTGTNFNRPAFEQMMEEVKFGNIDTIIVKDLSRFGRDYIGVGEYLEQLFPLLGVRFIAINDNYDSDRYVGTTMGLDMAVSNLVNTMYSRDTGKKRKTAIEIKWKKGISTGASAPFGYVFDPKKKGHFIIDPEAAKIVRRIFELALSDYSTKEIAYALNEEGIPTPSVYNEQNNIRGKDNHFTIAPKLIWNASKVWRILTSYEYTGAMIQGKSCIMLTGSKISRRVPKSKWHITENTHEAIVTHEEYDKAQMVIHEANRRPYINSPEFALRKKIRCGNCRRVMMHDFKQTQPIVYCREGIEMMMQTECSSEIYQISDIESAVFHTLKVMLFNLQLLCEQIKRIEKEQKNCVRLGKHKQENIEQEMKLLRAEKIHIYEEYVEQLLSIEEYKKRKQILDDKIEELSRKIQMIEREMDFPEVASAPVKRLAEQAEGYRSACHLTTEMVQAFIENVFVYDKQHIEVCFRFQDEIQKTIKDLNKRDEREMMGEKDNESNKDDTEVGSENGAVSCVAADVAS